MMIRTKEDLHFYLEEDRKRDSIPTNRLYYYIKLFAGCENVAAYNYVKNLRFLEYHLNKSGNSIYHKLLYFYRRFRHTRMGLKYGIRIAPNTCGYGLHIIHLAGGGGVLLNIKHAGNYCSFNSGVLLGTKDGNDNSPIIGDHVVFGPGAKAYGKITIGNNVFVASNAVVTRDIPDNCIVGGIPAKVLKTMEPLS